MRDIAVFYGGRYLVAWNHELASRLGCELEFASWPAKLGRAQCTRVLVLFIRFDVGNLGALFCFSSTLKRPVRCS